MFCLLLVIKLEIEVNKYKLNLSVYYTFVCSGCYYFDSVEIELSAVYKQVKIK